MKVVERETLPDGRTRTWGVRFEGGKPQLVVKTTQPVNQILDSNQREFNSAPERFGKSGFHKMAEIPVTVVEEECRLLSIASGEKYHLLWRELMANKTDRAKAIWRKLVNDRDFSKFRTRPGKVVV